MPELPEVETTRLGLQPHLIQQRVLQVEVRQPKLRWPVAPEISELLTGQIITSLDRRGKYLLFACAAGYQLIHLGMSGSLRLIDPHCPWRLHDHVQWLFSSGQALRFHDPRRFGSVLWTTQPAQHLLLRQLGPEPLSESFSAEHLLQSAQGRKIPLKSFIMNSRVVVGVGNIYASEALFLAGLHPLMITHKVTITQFRRLVTAVTQVLSTAIEQGGTTLRDFVNSSGNPGYFQQKLRVYGREGQPCYQCQQPLSMVKINQRSSTFCAHCQAA